MYQCFKKLASPHVNNTVVLTILTFQPIQCLHLMNAEVAWVLVSSGTQVQPQIIPDPDYLPDYLPDFLMTMDKLSFTNHIKVKIQKVVTGINVIKSLMYFLDKLSLQSVYKLFIRPHLYYGDVIYDQPNNESLSQIMESVQYRATLAITCAIKGTSQAKLYKESGLKTLNSEHEVEDCMLYKVKMSGLPLYLSKYMPKGNHS